MVQYKLKESYKRDILVSNAVARRRRAVGDDYSFEIRFMTYENSGILLHATAGSEFLLVQVKVKVDLV